MQLPGLLVEYLVIGSCALIWIWILCLFPGLHLPDPVDFAKLDGARIALMIPMLYVVGMIVDFVALITVQPLTFKYLRNREPGESSVALTAKILLNSVELNREYVLRSSRDRIARGTFINSVIGTIVLTIYLQTEAPGAVVIALPIGLAFSGLCFGMWYRHERTTYNYQKAASDALKEKLDREVAPNK